MDVAELRKRILRELDRQPSEQVDRRAAAETARQQFALLLDSTVVPTLKQTASILKAEGTLCDVHTPSNVARIAFSKSSEDFIEIMLDTQPPAHLIGRSSSKRKGGTVVEERLIGVGKEIEDISDEDVVNYLLPELAKILK